MYTSNTLPTDGSVGPFPIGINYLDGDNLVVTLTDLDGISNPSVVPFTISGSKTTNQPAGTTFSLVTAVAIGKLVTIAKVIDMDTPVIDWNTSAELSKSNLRKNTVNLMEMAQSAYDIADKALTRNGEVIDAINAIIPENVLEAAEAIQADRVAAEAAALASEASNLEAAAQVASIDARFQSKVTLDFGTGLHTTHKTFEVAVAGVTTSNYIRCDQVLNAATGRSQDENEMAYIVCRAACLVDGTITIYAEALDGSVTGLYNFALTY